MGKGFLIHFIAKLSEGTATRRIPSLFTLHVEKASKCSEFRTIFIKTCTSVASPGQSLSLHILMFTDVLFPLQAFPPNIGVGLLHSLVRFFNPSPQVFEQVVQLPQSPQLPSTKQECQLAVYFFRNSTFIRVVEISIKNHQKWRFTNKVVFEKLISILLWLVNIHNTNQLAWAIPGKANSSVNRDSPGKLYFISKLSREQVLSLEWKVSTDKFLNIPGFNIKR